MNVPRTITITLATAVCVAIAAQTALAGGEPKNESPFTRPVAERALARAAHTSRSAQAADPRGEPKNEWPFTRPVADPAASPLYDVGGTLVDPSAGGPQRGEAKNEPPFTQPPAAPTIVVRASGGFDWGDAGIGAAATLGLVIVVLGGAALRAPHGRRPGTTTA